jgi:hypothetical protein
MPSERRVVGTFRDADEADAAHDELAEDLAVSENDDEDINIGVGSEKLREDDSSERPPDITVGVDVVGADEVEAATEVLDAHDAEVVVVEPSDDR